MPPEDTDAGWFEPRYAAIAAGTIALIIYGSLYPFRFHARTGPIGPVRHLLATCHHSMDRGDLISNVLLYAPLGIFAAGSFRRLSPLAGAALAALLGLTLSAAIELTQFYDLTRSSDLCDVYANAAGALLGAAAAVLFRPGLFSRISRRPFVVLLTAIFLGDELFPYVPVLVAHRYAALERAFRFPHFPPLELYGQIVFWLAAAVLLDALFGAVRTRSILPIAILCVLSIRLANAVLTPVDVAAAIAAAALWMALSRWPVRIPVVAALFLVYTILQALQPFRFLPVPRHFGWIPFLSFIEGPRFSGTRVFLEKSFTYGALVWLWIRVGISWTTVTIAAAALELSLRLAQVYLPGRSAEVTDAIMVLMLAAVLKLIDDPRGEMRDRGPKLDWGYASDRARFRLRWHSRPRWRSRRADPASSRNLPPF